MSDFIFNLRLTRIFICVWVCYKIDVFENEALHVVQFHSHFIQNHSICKWYLMLYTKTYLHRITAPVKDEKIRWIEITVKNKSEFAPCTPSEVWFSTANTFRVHSLNEWIENKASNTLKCVSSCWCAMNYSNNCRWATTSCMMLLLFAVQLPSGKRFENFMTRNRQTNEMVFINFIACT